MADEFDLSNAEGIFIKAYDLVESLTNNDSINMIAPLPDNDSFGIETNYKNSRERTSNVKCMPSPPIAYKIGDYVRATYYVDGVDYEATILTINPETGTCVVRFLGYNNKEEVQICNLVASWGKKARRQQIAKAKSDENQPTTPTSATSQSASPFRIRSNGGCPVALPPPPIPPEFGQHLNETDVKLLSSMLVSWYMTGYYTGVYQGRMMSNNNTASKVCQPNIGSNKENKKQSK